MSGRRRALVHAAIALTPTAALAHSPIKDIGNFYGGLLHPLFIPAHVLLLGALGLLLGQQEPVENKLPLILFLVAAVAGLIIAGVSPGGEFETLQLSGAAAIGLLVAIHPTIPVVLRAIGSAVSGLLVGIDSGQPELAGAGLFASLVGTGLGMCIFLLCTMGFADYCREKDWQRIGIRVIGSWVAASALLVLSLSLSRVTA